MRRVTPHRLLRADYDYLAYAKAQGVMPHHELVFWWGHMRCRHLDRTDRDMICRLAQRIRASIRDGHTTRRVYAAKLLMALRIYDEHGSIYHLPPKFSVKTGRRYGADRRPYIKRWHAQLVRNTRAPSRTPFAQEDAG